MTPNKIYNKLIGIVEQSIGHDKTTTDRELDLCARLFFSPKEFLGVFPSDRVPHIKHGQFCIANVDKAHQPGSHWVAITHDLFYDSFGRSHNTLMKHSNLQQTNTEDDAEQTIPESNCGQRCIAFLLLYKYWGRQYAQEI